MLCRGPGFDMPQCGHVEALLEILVPHSRQSTNAMQQPPRSPGWSRVVRNVRARGSTPHVFAVRLLYFVGRPTERTRAQHIMCTAKAYETRAAAREIAGKTRIVTREKGARPHNGQNFLRLPASCAQIFLNQLGNFGYYDRQCQSDEYYC